MRPRFTLKKNLSFLLAAVLSLGSASVLASPDDDDDDERGGNRGSTAEALTATFMGIPPTAGKGFAHYFMFSGGNSIAFNADVRLALAKVDDDGNILFPLNLHLFNEIDDYRDAAITLFIGTDEDGDGTCLSEGPTSICVFQGGGGDDLVNDDDILHAAWALALRGDREQVRGIGTCWTDFDSTQVIPQIDENGNMTSVVFDIEGGEEAMPEISDGDGCMVGYGHPDFGFENINCGADSTCQIVPIMMGAFDD